jgi:phage shock protein A
LLETHLAEVQASIKAMQRSAKALQAKIEHYRTLAATPQAAPPPPERKRHDAVHKPLRTRP